MREGLAGADSDTGLPPLYITQILCSCRAAEPVLLSEEAETRWNGAYQITPAYKRDRVDSRGRGHECGG